MNSNTENNNNLTKLATLIVFSAEKQKLRKAVFSKPADKSVQKAVLTVKEAKNKNFLQIEYLKKDNKAVHQNYDFDASLVENIFKISASFSQINLITVDGECEYKRSSAGKEILLGAEKLQRRMEYAPNNIITPTANNREKKYILSGSEPFLMYLDVSDKNGRVYDRRQAKFRQINRFLELVRDIEDRLPTDEIYICDLCCGKSYLSFAVYHYFANIKGYTVRMTGVDLKPDVVERCNNTAKELNFSGLNFVCENVNTFSPETLPSLVISLHACDIATDFVLTRAAEWKTDVILSTPCCHHELNHNINSPELSFITDYSILRQKLCDAATDALRLLRLEAQGYSTSALELIDPDETPKNVMLRAVRKKNFNPESKEALLAYEKYIKAKTFLCNNMSDKSLHF